MANPRLQLLSRTLYDADGVTTNWDFNFSGGYILQDHVKAYYDLAGVRTIVTVTPAMLIGQWQLQITPPVPAGALLTIYRATPKNNPMVDFVDRGGVSEIALDTVARQAIFVAAEASDDTATANVDVSLAAATAANASAVAAAASQAAVASNAAAAAASAAAAAEDAAELAAFTAAYPTAATITPRTSANGAVNIANGTTAQRPASPTFGMQRANSTTGAMEWWNGTSWVPMGGGATGGGNDQIFWKNGKTITANHTILGTENAGSFGPITIADGVTVTVNDGGTWTVV